MSKSIKCTTVRVNPKVNCGLSVIMWTISVGSFVLKKKRTILVSNVANEGVYACAGTWVIKEISVSPFQLCCKPKTILSKVLKNEL